MSVCSAPTPTPPPFFFFLGLKMKPILFSFIKNKKVEWFSWYLYDFGYSIRMIWSFIWIIIIISIIYVYFSKQSYYPYHFLLVSLSTTLLENEFFFFFWHVICWPRFSFIILLSLDYIIRESLCSKSKVINEPNYVYLANELLKSRFRIWLLNKPNPNIIMCLRTKLLLKYPN